MAQKQQAAGTASFEGKYLTFSLEDEEFGISILKVKEIIGIMPITPVPKTPPAVKGIINLRGKVIPVIDLRTKFDMNEADATERTCIVVVDVTTQDQSRQMGIVVDSVSEVLNIKGEEIEDSPDFGGSTVDTDYIIGMAKTGSGVKILMDIDGVIAVDEVSSVI